MHQPATMSDANQPKVELFVKVSDSMMPRKPQKSVDTATLAAIHLCDELKNIDMLCLKCHILSFHRCNVIKS